MNLQKLNPLFWFGNKDDPLPPAWMWPTDPQWLRVAKWYIRNPMHNLFFYVLGVADKSLTVTGRAPTENLSPNGGWKLNWIKPAGGVPRPFISHAGKVEFYAGWRTNGALGFALRRNADFQPSYIPPK